jgi:hypothetical protein
MIRILLFLATMIALAIAGLRIVPQGYLAARYLAAADDPVALSDLEIERAFDATVAARQIEAALAAGDADLAQSFVDLAADRRLELPADLVARTAEGVAGAATTAAKARSFARGFFIGEPEDLASLAGTATGDLFVYGDIRDLVREGTRAVRGQPVDGLVLGLAAIGLGATGATYATLGAGSPARAGLSLFKTAARGGRLSAGLGAAIGRAGRDLVDPAALKAIGDNLLRPVAAVRAARSAVKAENAKVLVRLASDAGQIQAKAGTRAALDALKLADDPHDLRKLARLADAKGGKTRAVLKLLGRGAIALSAALFDLASAAFFAILNLLAFIAGLKRGTERIALRVIRARRRRREQRLAPFEARA